MWPVGAFISFLGDIIRESVECLLLMIANLALKLVQGDVVVQDMVPASRKISHGIVQPFHEDRERTGCVEKRESDCGLQAPFLANTRVVVDFVHIKLKYLTTKDIVISLPRSPYLVAFAERTLRIAVPATKILSLTVLA